MRVLIVARCKHGRYAPFITEQVAALEKVGVECQFFGVRQKGLWGYLKQYPELRRTIKSFRPDIIHAHYGLCGLLANLQRKVPVVTTYHGSDINEPNVLRLSRVAIRLSRFNIFVSKDNVNTAQPKKSFTVIPCGINLEDYPVVDRLEARKAMGLNAEGKYVLFAGAFNNQVKNAPLAKEAISLLPGVELLELKGYSRHQVALLMQAVDAFLMTSHTEGSPQVIKEALACGCPIVSVDVGDVKERIAGIDGCHIVDKDASSVAESLDKALRFSGRTTGRDAIIRFGLTNGQTIKSVIEVFYTVSQ